MGAVMIPKLGGGCCDMDEGFLSYGVTGGRVCGDAGGCGARVECRGRELAGRDRRAWDGVRSVPVTPGAASLRWGAAGGGGSRLSCGPERAREGDAHVEHINGQDGA